MIALLMGLKTVSPKKLHQVMREGNVTIFDVNSRESWRRARVPGARNIAPATYNECDLLAEKSSALVFYCSNPWCTKAPKAARRARKMGYDNVRVMSAGISGWLAAELPTESGG